MYNADKNFSSLTKKYPCQQYGLLPDTYSTTFLFVILMFLLLICFFFRVLGFGAMLAPTIGGQGPTLGIPFRRKDGDEPKIEEVDEEKEKEEKKKKTKKVHTY